MNFAISLVSNFEGWLTFLYEFDNYLNYFVLFALLFFGIMSWYYFIYFFLSLMPLEKFPKGEKLFKYAVLVPARNEDKVIVNLLRSLKEQDYNPDYFDVYVIVESKDDPTIQITKSFGYNVIIRKDLINKRTKGYALNEAYQYLKANNLKYDSLVIFDADNIVNKDFLSLMNDCKNKGYQVTVGYRNFTNASTNWISGCSGTLFSYMNQFTSNGRSFFFKKATLTGTGYYIDMDIVDNEGGWIWTGMTEDVELTCYCYYHNISMHYYNYAQYYDEQATSYKVLHKQHIRWVWGYFSSKKRFKNKKENYYDALPKWKYFFAVYEYNLSIYPFLVFTIMELICFILSLIVFFGSFPLAVSYNAVWDAVPIFFGFTVLYFAYVYLTYCLAAVITFIIDNKRLKFSIGKRLLIVFTYMFFFADFAFAFLDGLFYKNKRYSWDKIEHKGKILDEQAKGAIIDEEKKG